MAPIDRAALEDRVNKVFDQVITWRRHIHKNPDLSFQEDSTVEYIMAELGKLDPEHKFLTFKRLTPQSLVVDLKGTGGEGPIIALRADIDALPIVELVDLPFKSQKDGVMHACGHDTHAAMLMGAVKLLVEDAAKIKGTVRFLFQPAEEIAPGGAEVMIAKGCMDGVKLVFGMHIMPTPDFPSGKMVLRKGAALSSADCLEIEVIGRGGHASMPELSVDPVAISCLLVTALQQLVSRKMPSAKAPVFSIPTIRSCSDSFNVIPDKVMLKCSLRTQDPKIQEECKRQIETISRSVVEGMGGKCTFKWEPGYKVTLNDDGALAISEKVMAQVMNKEDYFYRESCLTPAEDFGLLSRKAPGNYMFLGSYNEAKGCTYANHNPHFKIDEDVLRNGVKVHCGHIIELLM